MTTRNYHADLQIEIDRIKDMLTDSDYHRGTAFFQYAMEYRNKLKRLRKDIAEDIDNGVEYFTD